MFRGITPINMDAKGRMAMPARYRDSIAACCDGKMVATIDSVERCLLLYPLPEWEVIEEKLASLPSLDASARRLQRLLLGYATEMDLDGNGRFLLPATLRDYADMDKKLVLLGQGKKFEIWSEDRWNSTRDTYLDDVQTGGVVSEQLQSLSL